MYRMCVTSALSMISFAVRNLLLGDHDFFRRRSAIIGDSCSLLIIRKGDGAEVKIPRHRDTGNVKGTAFVEMKSEEAFNQALL